MISFIKSNSNIFILIILLLMTFDSFLLAIKFKNRLDALPNLIISYDIAKSYFFNFYEDKLLIVDLNIKNFSTKAIDITNIKLIDNNSSYLAILSKDNSGIQLITLTNKDNSESVSLNIFSENILNTLNIAPNSKLDGYAIFKNIEPITDSKNYTILIETPKKTFQKEIILTPQNCEFHCK